MTTLHPSMFDRATISRSTINKNYLLLEVYKKGELAMLFILNEKKELIQVHFLGEMRKTQRGIEITKTMEKKKKKEYENLLEDFSKHFKLKLKILLS